MGKERQSETQQTAAERRRNSELLRKVEEERIEDERVLQETKDQNSWGNLVKRGLIQGGAGLAVHGVAAAATGGASLGVSAAGGVGYLGGAWQTLKGFVGY